MSVTRPAARPDSIHPWLLVKVRDGESSARTTWSTNYVDTIRDRPLNVANGLITVVSADKLVIRASSAEVRVFIHKDLLE